MNEGSPTPNVQCGIEEALKVFGDRWSLLIIRNVLMGINRFDALQEQLNISRNILTRRLTDLEDSELLSKSPIKPGAKRMLYNPTPKCLALAPVLVAMIEWSKNWSGDHSGRWSSVVDRDTGDDVTTLIVNKDQQPVPLSKIKVRL